MSTKNINNNPVEDDINDSDLEALDLKEDTWVNNVSSGSYPQDTRDTYEKDSFPRDTSGKADSSSIIEFDDDHDYTEDEADEAFDKAEKRNTASTIIRRIILIAAACTFCYSAFMLFQIFSEYKKGDDIYEHLQADILKEEQSTISVPLADTEVEIPFKYDHEALLAVNSDGVGYIHIPSLDVKYPIAKTDNNDYYLSHTFTREINSSGAIFEDSRINGKLEASHVILHGHRMQYAGMFGLLKKYRTESFYHKNGNDVFYIYTENKVMQYRIFSTHVTPAVGETYSINFSNLTELREYAAKMKALSDYDTGVDVSNATQVVTLSTCIDTENGTERLVVHAIFVAEAPLEY